MTPLEGGMPIRPQIMVWQLINTESEEVEEIHFEDCNSSLINIYNDFNCKVI
jgi:hypothetical protein